MDLLQDLAHAVSGACPPGYHQARLQAELDEGWAELDLQCTNDQGDQVMSQLPNGSGLKIHVMLDDIREQMARQAGSKWKSCVFTVQPDGRFKLDVQY